jgi:hypothetical protein
MTEKKITNKFQINSIDGNTHILFTVKTFIALLGTILGIFFGFYQMVVAPKIDLVEINTVKLNENWDENNKYLFNEFLKINNSIGELKNAVNNHIENTENNRYLNKNNSNTSDKGTINYNTINPNIDTLSTNYRLISPSKNNTYVYNKSVSPSE